MGDETNDWKLPSQNVLEYKKHIQLQIKEDLNESFEHLQSHEKQLQALLIKLDAAKNQVNFSWKLASYIELAIYRSFTLVCKSESRWIFML